MMDKLLQILINKLDDEEKKIIYESSDLTFYELRQLLTLLYRKSRKDTTREVLSEILKILTVLEIRDMPVPTIQKLKGESPKIWS